jgi:hypothetical protein
MSEIERRLRAAMHAAVDDLPAPADLLQHVRLRRRRRRVRGAAVAVVAAGALAVPPATLALHERAGPAAGPGTPSAPAPAPRAAPGTVLDGCASQVGAPLGRDWRRQSTRIGPFWLIGLKQVSASRYGPGRVALGGMEIAIQDNERAWITAAGAARNYFRFLFRQADFTAGVQGHYTLADGESGLTFVGCPANQSYNEPPGFTAWGGYFLVVGSPRCVSLDISASAPGRPTRMRVTFPVGRVRCGPG